MTSDRKAVIFCIDGLKASVFRKYVFQGKGGGPKDSVLRRLTLKPKDGGFNYISVERTKSIFPSYTIPAWAAIFTGNYPKKNGIVGNTAYYRDLDQDRYYDSFGLFYEENKDAIKLYGWDWNEKAFGEIACQTVTSLAVNGPELLRILIDGFDDACVWIWNPGCFILHSGFKPYPHKECAVNFYASGGIQNGDLLTPTLYDYAAKHGINTYVIHQFYNRSKYQASNWNEVYDGNIKNMNETWGRPTFHDLRDWKLPDPDNNRLFDSRAFEKALKRVKSGQIPEIMTVYTAAIDLETHKFRTFGYDDVDTMQLSGLAFMDREITELVNELERFDPQSFQNTLFFLIADHGLTENDNSERINGEIIFPGESTPGSIYRIRTNSYMAHLYIKSGQWLNIPTNAEIDNFMKKVLPFATFERGGQNHQLIDHVAFFVTRYHMVYRNWDGTSWDMIPLLTLDDREYGFVDGARRIDNLLNRYRAGDVIIVPNRSDKEKNTGFYSGDSSHGSLWPGDTYVPFYVWGEPLNEALKETGPVQLKEGNIVDLTPTVMSYLDILDSYVDEMDGKPLFDKDLNINLKDFELLEKKTAEIYEILFGRMVL